MTYKQLNAGENPVRIQQTSLQPTSREDIRNGSFGSHRVVVWTDKVVNPAKPLSSLPNLTNPSPRESTIETGTTVNECYNKNSVVYRPGTSALNLIRHRRYFSQNRTATRVLPTPLTLPLLNPKGGVFLNQVNETL